MKQIMEVWQGQRETKVKKIKQTEQTSKQRNETKYGKCAKDREKPKSKNKTNNASEINKRRNVTNQGSVPSIERNQSLKIRQTEQTSKQRNETKLWKCAKYREKPK